MTEKEIKGHTANSVFYMSGSLAVAFLNFAAYPIIGHLLSVPAFGQANLYNSFFLIGSSLTFISSLPLLNLLRQDKTRLAFWLLRFGFLASLILAGLSFLFFSFILPNIFGLSFYSGFVLAISLPLSFVFNAAISIYGASLRFGRSLFLQLAASGGRLLFLVIFLWLGFASEALLLAIVFSLVLAFFIFWRDQGAGLLHSLESAASIGWDDIKPEIIYWFEALAVVATMTFFYSSDIIFIRHYLGAEKADLFAGISTVAKIGFFLISPLSMVLYSGASKPKMPWVRLYNRSLLLAVGAGLALLLTFYLFYDTVLNLLVSQKLSILSVYLLPWSAVLWLLGIVQLNFYLLLARRRKLSSLLMLLGLAALFLLMYLHHQTLVQIIFNYFLVLLFWLFVFIYFYVKDNIHNYPSLQRSGKHPPF